MNEVTNEQLLSVLMDMKGDIGEIKATGTANASVIERHTTSISDLQMSHARLKGIAAALGVAGSAVGSVIGFLFHKN